MTPPAAAAIPATRPAPARRGTPTRPAGPARTRPSRPRRVAAPVRRPGRAAEAAAALAPARLLERLIRSRSWIGLVAFALIGIVAMQLWLLKLNSGIGRAIEHEELLQRTNAALSAENSSMAAGDLIEQQAIASGMRIVPPGSLIFLHTRGQSDERLAAARLARPVRTPTAESTSTSETASTAKSASTTESTSTAAASASPGGESTATAPSTEGSAPATTQSATPSTAVAETSAPTSTPTAPEAGG
jgi:hypothetical protein